MEDNNQKSTMSEEIEFFGGDIDSLKKIIEDVGKRDELAVQLKNMSTEKKRLEKELEEEKKNLEKDIKDSIQYEMNKEIESENKTIKENTTKLKQAKSKREKAKGKGVKNRIENETAHLSDENRALHRLVRKKFKENGLPAYCDTKWFYTLYCAQSGLEWIIRLLVFACGLVFIPWLVVKATNPWFFLKVIVWLIVAILFVAVYMTIYLCTKDKDNGILEEMREHRDKIADNEKEIRKIKKGIKSDDDESIYNLEDYDSEIKEYEDIIERNVRSKEDKLKEFEEVRKQEIIEELTEKHRTVIEGKEKMIADNESETAGINDAYIDMEKLVAEKYEKFLTKSCTNKASLDKMLELMEKGEAETIGQAYSIVG